MGAKQSKRSVDISGKEAEGGGEVAAAGAGGEGRVEQLADVDALKPQLNGAAHIQHEPTDKEKELDSGTPENEKDATTEKEGKEEEEKEAAPVTNGESEPKVENGESTPTPEDGKKPKKEKVKKKWSLRSISFSRKDKPKQEKKQKEEEPKTNGEPEKVPEETAEAVPEAAANEVAEEAKAPAEDKDEKTPETPVTEPLTNGTSTPESKAETPASEEAAPAAPAPATAPEPAPAPAPAPAAAPTPEPTPEPEKLPVNGLSLEESKPETPEVEKPEETKPEPPVAETAEIVPAPEIPKEVCVEQLPLLEPTPPPLPANPPPSSVASFAATTMAPELTDASLANTADAIAPLSALPDTKDILLQPELPTETALTKILENEITFVLKETNEDTLAVDALEVANDANIMKREESPKPDIKAETFETSDSVTSATVIAESPEMITRLITGTTETVTETVVTETSKIIAETMVTETPEPITETVVPETPEPIAETVVPEILESFETVVSEVPDTTSETVVTETTETVVPEAPESLTESLVPESILETVVPDMPRTIIPEQAQTEATVVSEPLETDAVQVETVPPVSETSVTEIGTAPTENVQIDVETPVQSIATESLPEPEKVPESEVDISEADDSSLPPPPMQDEDESAASLHDLDEKVEESLKQIPEPIANNEQTGESNHISNVETTNGEHDIGPDAEKLKKKAIEAPPGAAPTAACNGAAPAEPRLTNGAAHAPQDPLPVSDKLADLIPEVPDVPELKPETLQETVTDVAVAN